MKGIILCGGFGTRLFPATKVTNKHLLPVFNRPMIYYPLETLIKAGIKDILIVTGIEHAGDFLKLLGDGGDFIKEINQLNGTAYPRIRLHYTVQKGAGGIAEALGLAEDFAEHDPITVILGDNIFQDNLLPEIQSFTKGAKIFLKEHSQNHRFGVPAIENSRVVKIEEKPARPLSPYAVTGLYIYDSRVFDIIKTLKPSGRGELEITDVNNQYIQWGEMQYAILNGFWSDAGTFESLLQTALIIRETLKT